MPSGKQILEDLAAIIAKHSQPQDEDAVDGGADDAAEGDMPMVKKMAQKADPEKRAKAAQSMAVAFGNKK